MEGRLSNQPASPAAAPALEIVGLGKTFPGTVALSDVDLAVKRGEVHALVGQNGSGKSTLVKVLSGYVKPDPGAEIRVGGRPLASGSAHASFLAGCRFVHQDLGLVDSLSVADNLSLTGGWPTRAGTVRERSSRARAREALGALGLEVDPAAPVGSLAPATRTGVAVARALAPDPRAPISLLVLDEPTATLPQAEIVHLLEVVRSVARQGIGVLFVSHHLDEVIDVAARVTVLRSGRKVATREASGLTRRQLVVDMVGEEVESVSAPPVADRAGSEPALEVRDLVAGAAAGVSFTAHPGEVVGIAGITGSGKEDVLAALFGAIERPRGTVRVGARTLPAAAPRAALAHGVAFLPGDRDRRATIAGLNARENMTLASVSRLFRGGRIRRAREREQARGWFERLDIRPPGAFEAPIEAFSGGNRQKIALARLLGCEPRVLLLDEPTQGVDVSAQARLHREILGFAERGAAVVVSSSDSEELVSICGRVIVLRAGAAVTELRGEQVAAPEISRAMLGSAREVAV